jgi:N-acetylmuramic acid 6-phosphate etherase
MNSRDTEAKAREFLARADQFRLGQLLTEQPHPQTRNLSQTTASDPAAGLQLLLEVDRDVIATYRTWAHSGAPEQIAATVVDRLARGGRIFFTGCGATGRLSIQLAAMWRDHWQRIAATGAWPAASAADWENRAFSVMAGGDFALIKSVEGFEDYAQFGQKQLADLGVAKGDVVFAITEGGETSFVIGTAWQGLAADAKVYFVYNNPDHLLQQHIERSRKIIEEDRIQKINLTTGPMAITGSTRMQATSIQLCVMGTLLEMVLSQIPLPASTSTRPAPRPTAPGQLSPIPAAFLRQLEEIHATLQTDQVRRAIAQLVHREEEVYRRKQRNNYFADRLAIDVLTDTTERSPTFCIPAFKKFGDSQASESWSFLFLPPATTPEAWQHLLKRDLQPVEWNPETILALVGEADCPKQSLTMQAISRPEILRFRIGLDGLACRPTRPDDSATAILTEAELPQLLQPTGFYRQQLEAAHAQGGHVSVVFFGSAPAIERLNSFLDQWPVDPLRLCIPIPEPSSLLHSPLRVGAKLLLNALSTLTMVRLGRVHGNVMVWVVPSNLKLIDRSIRYILLFTDLDYAAACHLLHQAIAYVAPRMTNGREYPSTVSLCLIVHRDRCSWEEAEAKLTSGPIDGQQHHPDESTGPPFDHPGKTS